MQGLDLSFSKAPRQWWDIRWQEGYRVMAQCLWTGGAGSSQPLASTAPHNIKEAHARGFQCHGYLNASPWNSDPVGNAKRIAGDAWPLLSRIWVDVEIDGVTEAIIRDACEKASAEKPAGLYSARWFWTKLGNPQWPWLLDYPVWVADYDGDPRLETAALFGPWTEAYGKQFTNTQNVDGVEIDLDTFKEDDMGIPDGTQAQIDDIQKDVDDLKKQNDDLVNVHLKAINDKLDALDKKISGGQHGH